MGETRADALSRILWDLYIEDCRERGGQDGMPSFTCYADGAGEPCHWREQSEELREWHRERARLILFLLDESEPVLRDPDLWCAVVEGEGDGATFVTEAEAEREAEKIRRELNEDWIESEGADAEYLGPVVIVEPVWIGSPLRSREEGARA